MLYENTQSSATALFTGFETGDFYMVGIDLKTFHVGMKEQLDNLES